MDPSHSTAFPTGRRRLFSGPGALGGLLCMTDRPSVSLASAPAPMGDDKKSPGNLVLLTRAHSLLSLASLQWDFWLRLGQRVIQPPSVHDRGLRRSGKIKSAISTPGRPAP